MSQEKEKDGVPSPFMPDPGKPIPDGFVPSTSIMTQEKVAKVLTLLDAECVFILVQKKAGTLGPVEIASAGFDLRFSQAVVDLIATLQPNAAPAPKKQNGDHS